MRRFILSCCIILVGVLGSAAPGFAQNCVHVTGTNSFVVAAPTATMDLSVGGTRYQVPSTRTVLAEHQFGSTTFRITSHRLQIGSAVVVTQDISVVAPTGPGVARVEVRMAVVSGAARGFLYQQGQVNFATGAGSTIVVGTICF